MSPFYRRVQDTTFDGSLFRHLNYEFPSEFFVYINTSETFRIYKIWGKNNLIPNIFLIFIVVLEGLQRF